ISYYYLFRRHHSVLVLAPFPDVPVHVKKSQIVRPERSHWMGLEQRVCYKPSILVEQILWLAKEKHGFRPCSTGILPFRFGRQTIPRPVQIIDNNLHACGILAFPAGLVTPLVLRNPFLLVQPVAVGRRVVPFHHVYRAFFRRSSFVVELMALPKSH